MTDEHFLTRWSRRKRAVATEQPAPVQPDDADDKALVAVRDATDMPERIAAPDSQAVPAAFDPASLPSLDSITEGTDVRGFLAPGVPSALTREALRRAWSADPAIRDFVGLQEYDWDFNTPGAIAGFGELGSEFDAKRMAARILGDHSGDEEEVAEAGEADPVPGQAIRQTSGSDADQERGEGDQSGLPSRPAGQPDPSSGTVEAPERTVALQQPQEIVQRNKEIAMQYDDFAEPSGQKKRRSHGGALPKT